MRVTSRSWEFASRRDAIRAWSLGRRAGGLRIAELGRLAGGLDYALVIKALARFAHRLARVAALAQQLPAIENQMSQWQDDPNDLREWCESGVPLTPGFTVLMTVLSLARGVSRWAPRRAGFHSCLIRQMH